MNKSHNAQPGYVLINASVMALSNGQSPLLNPVIPSCSAEP